VNDERFRRACLAALAMGLSLGTGCEARERWPAAAEREKPKPIAPPLSGECDRGTFCIPRPDQVAGLPAPSFEDCASVVVLPAEQAGDLTGAARDKARIRFDEIVTRRERASTGEHCCYTWFEHCRGRPIVLADKPQLALATSRSDWASPRGLPQTPHARLATHWKREAAHEHASIAAFARTARELVTLGAPAMLVADCHRAARQELRHARIAYALASRYGPSVGPCAFPRLPHRRGDIVQLASETFVQACVTESVAAALVAECARRAADPGLRGMLRGIADDEREHAALAWRILGWCLATDRRVRPAIAEAWARLSPPAPASVGPSDLEAHGVLASTTRAAAAQRAFHRVVRPCAQVALSGRACA
jgi:hypothetical protein